MLSKMCLSEFSSVLHRRHVSALVTRSSRQRLVLLTHLDVERAMLHHRSRVGDLLRPACG
jgi:hypothetical protein